MGMFNIQVVYDDGTEIETNPGQREIAAWEMEPFGCGMEAALKDKQVSFFRYVAWAWLKRTKGEQRTFHGWSARVDEIRDTPGEPADPTSPDQPPGD